MAGKILETNAVKILESAPPSDPGTAVASILPFNNIKGSLVAPESSSAYSFSRIIHILKNLESFQNHRNHTGIIAESYLNHSLREATRGGTRSPYGRRMCPSEVSKWRLLVVL